MSSSRRSAASVLLVIADNGLRNDLTAAITQLRLEVVGTDNARDALGIIDRFSVAATVIDAELPLMSGFDLAKAIRRHKGGNQANIVILTDVKWSLAQKAAAIRQMGIVDVLTRPVDAKDLAAMLLELLPVPTVIAAAATVSDTVVTDHLQPEQATRIAPYTQDPGGARGFIAAVDDGDDEPDAEVDSNPDLPAVRAATAPADHDADDESLIRAFPPRAPADALTEAATAIARPKPGMRKRRRTVPGTELELDDIDDSTEVAPPAGDEWAADPQSRQECQQVEQATAAARLGPVELRGSIAAQPFPVLLHTLYIRRMTGALFLLNDRVKKIVYFRDGHPTYIKSNLLTECLGKVLVQEGMISEVQCQESLRRMEQTVRQQGTILIDMGAISPHDLVVGLTLQLRRKLMDIFRWNAGEFLFKVESKVPSEVIRLDVSNAALIAQGVRLTWDEDRLAETLAPLMEMYPATAEDPELRFQELDLEDEEQAFLDRVDGLCTLRELLADAPLTQRRALAVAYILYATEVITFKPAAAEFEAFDVSYASLPDEARLREQLAQTLVALRHADAYTVLGVSPAADDRRIRLGFEQLARRYHTDRYRRLSRETQRVAQQLFVQAREAFDTICTADRRGDYQQPIGLRTPSYNTSAQVLEAEEIRRRAQQLIDEDRWPEARQLMATAVKLCPDAGDLRSQYAWSIYMSSPEDATMLRTAIREMRRAIELDPEQHRPYLYLGRIYASVGKAILAEKQFEKALQCNPDCQEALKELSIQKGRRPGRRFRG